MPKPTRRDLITLRRHDYLMGLVEAPYRRALVKEKNRYIQLIADTYLNNGINDSYQEEHAKKIKEISEFYNNKIISVFAADVQTNTLKDNNIKLEVKQDSYDKWLNTLIAAWISNFAGVKAIAIAETTTQDIRNAIEKAISDGEDRPQVAKKILKAKGFSAFRADMIARTETHNAAMYAGKESAKRLSRESGTDLLKVWVPVEDSRTRDSHARMVDHEPIGMESLFDVDGERMDRPGDPNGSAKNVIHCRCTLSYRTAD